MSETTLRRWHEAIERRDMSVLDEILADDVVFHSPVVHTPQRGKAITKLYLAAAAQALGTDSFSYVRQVLAETDAVLEFTTEIDGIHINGVDMMRFDDDGRITDFKVMLRPLKAVNLVHATMKRMLEALSKP